MTYTGMKKSEREAIARSSGSENRNVTPPHSNHREALLQLFPLLFLSGYDPPNLYNLTTFLPSVSIIWI